GYVFKELTGMITYDGMYYDDVSFRGIANIDLFGASGSSNTVLVAGNTASNLSISTGGAKDTINVAAPAPTTPRGGLMITASGDSNIALATGTLDFANLQIWAGTSGPATQTGSLFLDDSQSTVPHSYTFDGDLFIRDGRLSTLAAHYRTFE